MFKSQVSTKRREISNQFNYFPNIPGQLSAELYPRRRKTENFYEPSPQTEFQSREPEHPKKYFELCKNVEYSKANRHISPPTSSETRVLRDSYFS